MKLVFSEVTTKLNTYQEPRKGRGRGSVGKNKDKDI